jgi:asparagine synthase (glutamine-hydrolysing)
MCGICGVFLYAREGASVDERVLLAMRDEMVHRGPDDSGIYLSADRRLGLGFRRLSIVDLSPAGNQPMANEDGSLRLLFNGEIYNHADHRPALQQKGHRYRSQADSETLLHLYEEHGVECVQHLRGMFAFAIWDEPRRRLFLARDRVGIKPLYYTRRGGAFLFGSEIKALLAYPGTSPEVDDEALYHYLTFMIPPAPLTLFKGIYKLPPAHWLTIDAGGELRQEQYWEPLSAAPGPSLSESEAVERLRALLEESVRLRMMSDVPFGAFLSGGIDSSSIVALMARQMSQPVNTYTVGYKDSPASNELVHARRIAHEFGARHHEVMIDAQDMLEYMPRLVHTQDEPLGDPVCVPLFYVSRLAQQSGVKVIQVGEGSDELFCGYPWYLPYLREEQSWNRWSRLLPEGLLRAIYGAGVLTLDTIGRAPTLADMLERRRRGERTFWGGAVIFNGRSKGSLLNPEYWGRLHFDSLAFIEKQYRRAVELRPELDFLGQMVYLELKQRLPELLLMRVDKVSMSVSLEARVPFLDHRLVEFALPLPSRLKIRTQPKHLLKKAVEGLIPQETIYRPKQGFPAPVKQWFRNLPGEMLRRVLLDGPLARRRYFNQEFVERLLAEQLAGRRNWSGRLWLLYNLGLWYAHWIERSELA